MDELHRGSSQYHEITVEQHDGLLELRFSGRSQGATDAETRLEPASPVLGYLHIPVAVAPEPRRALIIGLGGGVLPRGFLHDYPEMLVDVAEIDPEVVRVCEQFFGLPADERLRVIVSGGREYLEMTDERYDLIVVDAFFVHPTAGYATPFGLVTEEFFRVVRDRLTPTGVLAFNIVGALEGRGSGPLHSLFRGMRDVFASAFLFVVASSQSKVARRKNYVAIASNERVSADEVRSRIRSAAEGSLVTVEGFVSFADDLIEPPFNFRGVRAHRDADMPPTGLMQG